MRLIEGQALSKGARVRATVSGKEGSVVEVYNGFADVLFDGEEHPRAVNFMTIDLVPEKDGAA